MWHTLTVICLLRNWKAFFAIYPSLNSYMQTTYHTASSSFVVYATSFVSLTSTLVNLRKEDDDWVKKCMEYEVEGPRPKGRPKRTWREVVQEDCQARKMNREDAIDRCKWRKMIKNVR